MAMDNSPDVAVTVRLPRPVAEALIQDGQAKRQPSLRSPVPQLLVEGVTAAATTITLLQGPAAVKELARQLRAWAGSQPDQVADASETPEPTSPTLAGMVIYARTADRELRMHVCADTDISAIVELLNRTIFSQAQ